MATIFADETLPKKSRSDQILGMVAMYTGAFFPLAILMYLQRSGNYTALLTRVPAIHYTIAYLAPLLTASVASAFVFARLCAKKSPIVLFLIMFSVLGLIDVMMCTGLVRQADENSAFVGSRTHEARVFRVYGARASGGRHVTYYAELNPRLGTDRQPSIPVDYRAYSVLFNAVHPVEAAGELIRHRPNAQTDYCIDLAVEKSGPYERIVITKGFDVDESYFFQCPANAV